MAALQDDLLVAEILRQPPAFIIGGNQALVIVIADRPEPHRVLIAGNEAVLLHRRGGRVFRVQMHDALRLRERVVDAFVKRKGEFVRQLVARLDVIAVFVKFMQV